MDATAVTTERLLSKYCDRMVTVGRKLKQYPKPVGDNQKGRVRTVHGLSLEGWLAYRSFVRVPGANPFILQKTTAKKMDFISALKGGGCSSVGLVLA